MDRTGNARGFVSAITGVALAGAILGAGLSPAGCQSKKETAGTAARASAVSFRETLATMPAEIEGTVRSLETAVDVQQTKPWEASGKFESELRAMRKTEKTLRAESDKAIADSERYFAEWRRDATKAKKSPATREAELASEEAARGRAVQMRETLRQAADDYRKMVDAAESFKGRLGQGVSAETLQAIRADFDQVVVPGLSAKQKVEALLAQMATLG